MAPCKTGALLLLASLAACGGPGSYGGVAWDGRRGYDGRGDYGYDLAASRAEAGAYRARASRVYAVPGTPDDPWGPYIREASSRFGIPEDWVRGVMRQESGGRLYASDGSLITSSAGAMGLMQVMPATYDRLRARLGLGADPYDPRDNILAGTAYLRDMYDRFGFPHFLAAYNAGPERVALYLTGAKILPDETENYVASIVPRLSTAYATASAGPSTPLGMATGNRAYDPSDRAFEGGGLVTAAAPTGTWTPAPTGGFGVPDPSDRAFEGGGLVTATAPTGTWTPPSAGGFGTRDPSDRAFEGGGLVTATAPTGTWTPAPSPGMQLGGAGAGGNPIRAAAPQPWGAGAPVMASVMASPGPALGHGTPAMAAPGGNSRGAWGIQVGAFPNPADSRAAAARARARAANLLAGSSEEIIPVSANGTLYRARLVGLSPGTAQAACATLSGGGMPCFTVPPAGF